MITNLWSSNTFMSFTMPVWGMWVNQSPCRHQYHRSIWKSSRKRKCLRLILNELSRWGYPKLTRYRFITNNRFLYVSQKHPRFLQSAVSSFLFLSVYRKILGLKSWSRLFKSSVSFGSKRGGLSTETDGYISSVVYCTSSLTLMIHTININ